MELDADDVSSSDLMLMMSHHLTMMMMSHHPVPERYTRARSTELVHVLGTENDIGSHYLEVVELAVVAAPDCVPSLAALLVPPCEAILRNARNGQGIGIGHPAYQRARRHGVR